MKIKRISSRDINRVILTETLPYERPFRFSNDFFYTRISRESWSKLVSCLGKISEFKSSQLKPLLYEAAADSRGTARKLTIPHPLAQIKVIEFYKKFSSSIISHSSRSPYSIRTQENIARFNSVSTDQTDSLDEILPTSIVPRNYFKIGPFDLIAKFYRSTLLRSIELKYNFCLQLDIKKCFYTIYTHSITWSIYGKKIGKNVRSLESFGYAFDSLMQDLNWRETNGIVVGPEVSRIFADILLGGIDVKLFKYLHEHGYSHGEHYVGYRYVDDYSFYSNDLSLLKNINEVLQRFLLEIKLFVNTDKTRFIESPYSNDSQRLECEIRNRVYSLLNQVATPDKLNEIYSYKCHIKSPARWSGSFITDIRFASNFDRHTAEIAAATTFIRVYRYLENLLSEINSSKYAEASATDFKTAFQSLLPLLFYFYKVNPKTSSTVKLAKIVVQMLKISSNSVIMAQDYIVDLLRFHSLVVIDFLITTQRHKEQVINICTLITALGQDSLIKPDTETILEFYRSVISSKDDCLYFAITSYIQNYKTEVLTCSDELNINKLVRSIFQSPRDLMDCEKFMLFFDLLSCPYILTKTKVQIATATQLYKSGDHKNNEHFRSACSGYPFFYGWGESVDLEKFAESMEWRSVY